MICDLMLIFGFFTLGTGVPGTSDDPLSPSMTRGYNVLSLTILLSDILVNLPCELSVTLYR